MVIVIIFVIVIAVVIAIIRTIIRVIIMNIIILIIIQTGSGLHCTAVGLSTAVDCIALRSTA